ncbi:MAG: BLUF domain-containing protein [Pseudomonadales bacterium]|jgi:uncharacterized protein (UPF0254 family)
MSKLSHIIYASRETSGFSQEDMLCLLSKSRERNKKQGITGILLYIEGSFFQVLEGEENSIEELYNKVFEDERHKKVTRIIGEGIAERKFTDWSMGYASISRGEVEKIDGLNEFFLSDNYLEGIDSGRAKRLLDVFAEGRWRLS